MCYFDYGFRHFWTSKSRSSSRKTARNENPRAAGQDIRRHQSNGLGGSAVPMAYGEVVTAAKQGVIDGGDLPIVNMKALRSTKCRNTLRSPTNYGPTNAVRTSKSGNGLNHDHRS